MSDGEESPKSPKHEPVSPDEDPLAMPVAAEQKDTGTGAGTTAEHDGTGTEGEGQAEAAQKPSSGSKDAFKNNAVNEPKTPEPSKHASQGQEPPPPPVKDGPDPVSDAALAQLVSMGYEFEDATLAISEIKKMYKSTEGVPAEALVDGAIQFLAGSQNPFQAVQDLETPAPRNSARTLATSPPTPSTPLNPPKQPKPILKTPAAEAEKPSIFSAARSWLTSHLPTSVSTIGNTFANTLKSPSGFAADWTPDGKASSSGDLDPFLATPIGVSQAPPVPPKHPKAGKRVRFSFHDITFPPPADFDEHEPTFGLQSSSSASGEEGGAGGPSELKGTAGEEPAEAAAAAAEAEPEPFVRKPPGEHHTPSEVFRLYMSECDRRREQPIPRLIEDMQEAFAKEEGLHKIDLTGTVIDKKNVYPLAEILAVEFGLKQLSLEACGLDDDCLKILLNNLLSLDSLPWLNISGNRKLSNNGLKFVAIYVKKSKSLKYLDLSHTALDRTACTYITHALSTGPAPPDPSTAAPGANLEVLKLEDCKLRSGQLEVLVPGVAFSNLHYLSLRKNNLDADAASWVAEMIRPDDELRKLKWKRGRQQGRRKVGLGCLDLRENDLKNGVGSIAQSLALNSALKQLILRDNKIGPGGLDVLSEVLKINHGLTSLDLGSNPLGSASTALERLKDALAINKSLKELSFSSVGLSSEACVTLAEALPLSSLSRLDLTFNPIDVAGMMAIAASLKANSTITDVEVVPVLKQARDGGGRLVEEDPQFTRLLDEIAAQCEKTAVKVKEEEDSKAKELEDSGRTQEDIEREEEEEEEREMIAQAQREEKDRIRRQEERERAEAERAANPEEAPMTPRKFDAASITQDYQTARESFGVLQELLAAGGAESEVIEQLYLQLSELEGRLLAAVNNNIIPSEKLLGEVLALNDAMRPVLQSCEGMFASVPPTDVKGKSPAMPQRPLPPTPPGSSSAAEPEETPLLRRRPAGETLSKPLPTSPSPASKTKSEEELESFLEEIDQAVSSSPVAVGKDKDLEESTDHLVEDIDSLLKESQ